MTQRPMRDMLERVSGRVSLHMPGAQGRAPFGEPAPYRLETTELPVTDDLYQPSGAITRAEALAARSAGAAHTLMLCGGGTAGVYTMLWYAARRGEAVILPRTAHLSALNACAVAGIEPVFAPAVPGATGRPYVPMAAYLRCMDERPDARAALVTSPDYYGALFDVAALSRAARARGILTLVDAAHGAHRNWDARAQKAGALGAELVAQSAHKTLPALNGGAWLHASAEVDVNRLRRVARMAQTSSPSFVSLMALDDARAWMDEHGAAACEALRGALERFRREAARLGFTDGQDEPGLDYDPLRLVLGAPMGGYALACALASRGLDAELADERRVVCILSLMDGPSRLDALLSALKDIAAKEATEATAAPRDQALAPPTAPPPRVMPLAKAAFAPSERVPLASAVGRVSAGLVGAYPPGIALVAPGERVTLDVAEYLSSLPPGAAFGVDGDGLIECVREEEAKP